MSSECAEKDRTAEVRDFLRYRQALLTNEVTGITSPPTVPSTEYYRPFEFLPYDTWEPVRQAMQSARPNPNVFIPSRYRDKGLAVWDAAAGMRACGMRGDVVDINTVAPVRAINSTWEEALRGILRIGNLGGERIKRPSGPFVYDLQCIDIDKALLITDIANVLTQMYREVGSCGHINDGSFGGEAALYARTLGYVLHAILYNLPIRVDFREPGGCEGYAGNTVRADNNFREPVIKVPWRGVEAPVLDETVTETLMSALLHPHPSGYEQQLVRDDYDFLALQPSSMAVVGFEGVDWITHCQLGRYKWSPDLFYVADGRDLLPPELYRHLLTAGTMTQARDGKAALPDVAALEDATLRAIESAAAKAVEARDGKHGDEADDAEDCAWLRSEGIRYIRPLKWVETPHFRWARSRAECLPRKQYLRINRNTEDAIPKPRGKVPTTSKRRMPREWQEWHQNMKNIYMVILNCRKHWEGVYGGVKEAKETRASRRRQNVRRRKHIMTRCKYEAIMQKYKTNGSITGKEMSYVQNVRGAGDKLPCLIKK